MPSHPSKTHQNKDGDKGNTELVDTCLIVKGRSFDWGYHDSKYTYSAEKWSKHYNICGNAHQSPINIITGDVQLPVEDINPLTIAINDGEDGLVFGYLINNGHALFMNIDEARSSVTIKGGPIGTIPYKLGNFHIHFSCDDQYEGSEHTIDGEGYDAEVHFVFHNPKYENCKTAMPHSDGLAVLGFFISIGENINKGSFILHQYLDGVEEPNKSVYMKYGFRISEFVNQVKSFGQELPYYYYKGSLTTPPCYESVQWIVFREPVTVTKHDLDKWRKLKSHHGRICDNNRPTQPLNDRTVYEVNM